MELRHRKKSCSPSLVSFLGARIPWLRPILLSCALLPQVAAAAPNGWQFEVSGATSDVTRGIVDSDRAPVIATRASWYPDPGGGFFVGASALTLRSSTSSRTGGKFVASTGYTWRIHGDWTVQALLSRYQFANVKLASRMNYDEIALRGGWRDVVFVSVTASPNTGFGSSPRSRAFSYDIAGRLPLDNGFSATAGIGYYDVRAQVGTGFVYADAGVTYQYGSAQLDLWYIGTHAPPSSIVRATGLLAHGWVADVIWHF